MEQYTEISEGALRLAFFAGIFAIMAGLEFLLPRRTPRFVRADRWWTNLLIGGIDSVLVRLMSLFVVPIVATGAALWAEQAGVGLLNSTLVQALAVPLWIEIIFVVVLLDLAIYAQHVASHKFPILWRLHQVHHADPDFDVTTAIRFHPVEIGLSMLYKVVLVLLLGPAAIAVVIFEIQLNGCAMFNHANVALPPRLDRFVRMFLVTPDMHRVHHSVKRREHDTNYGFSLSIWDRIFATYTPQPEDGHTCMRIGLTRYSDDAPTRLWWSLLLPFRSGASEQGTKAGAETPDGTRGGRPAREE